jgi:hypothetical protein
MGLAGNHQGRDGFGHGVVGIQDGAEEARECGTIPLSYRTRRKRPTNAPFV